jgi:hypothetical protein
MKIVSQIVVLCALTTNVAAFTLGSKAKSLSSVVLRETPASASGPGGAGADVPTSSLSNPDFNKLPQSSSLEMYPGDIPLKRMEGEGTIHTYQMPSYANRCQYEFRTDGRPLKAKIEMWIGPIRKTHNLEIYMQDGKQTPYRGTLKFKNDKGPQVLKVRTLGTQAFPIWAGVSVPSPERSEEIADLTNKVWDANPKELIQGGETMPKTPGGAVRTFPIATNVDQVQILFWSKNVGSRSCKCLVEVLQGPNNKKQVYDLHLSGGSQPYHAVYSTPGEGWTIRLMNKNFLEFPFEVVVLPYKLGESGPAIARPTGKWWEKK